MKLREILKLAQGLMWAFRYMNNSRKMAGNEGGESKKEIDMQQSFP